MRHLKGYELFEGLESAAGDNLEFKKAIAEIIGREVTGEWILQKHGYFFWDQLNSQNNYPYMTLRSGMDRDLYNRWLEKFKSRTKDEYNYDQIYFNLIDSMWSSGMPDPGGVVTIAVNLIQKRYGKSVEASECIYYMKNGEAPRGWNPEWIDI
jgi:hypothetical protein